MQNFFGYFFPNILNEIRKFTRVSKFHSFHKTKQCKYKTKAFYLFFYNLAEFVFEYFCGQSELLQNFLFSQIGHVRCINILTCSKASDQNCNFLKLLLSLNSRKRLGHKESNTRYRRLSRKPRSHVRILIYRTWHIAFRNMIIPLPRYHTHHLGRASAPLPLLHMLFWHDKSLQTPTPVCSFSPASEVTRSPHGNKMSQNYDLKRLVRFRHTNEELMKDSHKKEKGDIGLDQEELARGGTSL